PRGRADLGGAEAVSADEAVAGDRLEAESAEARAARRRLGVLLLGRDVPSTPGASDFCLCGGSFVTTPRRPGRECGACGSPEPEEVVAVRDLDGRLVWTPVSAFQSRTRDR